MPRPTTPTTAPRRRSRKRRVLLGSLVGVLALLVVVWFLRANLLERVVTRLARTRAGLDVRFEELEIEGLSRVRATRIVVDARSESEILRHAEVDDFELALDVRGLWSDEVVVESIGARAARIEVDATRAEPSAPSSGPPHLRLPASWPATRIGALDVDVVARAGSARLRGARIDLGARPGPSDVAVDARELALADAAHSASGALALRASVEGDALSIELARWESVAEIHGGRFAPTPDGGFEARLEIETRIGSGDLEARSDARDVAVRGSLDRVDLASVLRLLGVETDQYGGSFSARGSFVLPIAQPGRWTADADVVAAELRIAGRDADVIAGRFLATAATLEVRDALVHAGANLAQVGLVRIPRAGNLGCDFLERATIEVDADLADVQSILGDAWRIPEDAPPHRVRGRAALADHWLQVEHATAEIGASRLEVGATRFPLGTGARLFLLDPSTSIDLAVRTPDSAELARLLLPASVAEGIALEGAVAGSVVLRPSPTGVTARVVLGARDASIRHVAIDELELEAELDAGVLAVERAVLRAGATEVRAHGAVDVGARQFTRLEVEADVPDVRDLGRALGLGAELPDGHASLRARLDGPIEAPDGSLELDATDVVVAGVDLSRVVLRAHGADGGIVVDRLAADVPIAGSLDAAGRIRRDVAGDWSVDVERLAIDALEGSLDLARPAHVVVGPDLLSVESLELAGGEGALRVTASRVGGGICADVELETARVGRVLRAFGVRAPESLRLDGRATVELHPLADASLDGTIDARMRVSVLDLADLELPRGFTAAGRADLLLEISGPWRDPQGVIDFDAHGLDLRDAKGEARIAGAECSARARIEDRFELESFALDLTRDARIEATGGIGLPLDLELFARGDLAPVRDATLHLSVTADAPDLAPLADAFEILRRTEGSLSAQLELGGTVASPQFTGLVLLREGGVKLSATLPAISGVEVDVAIEHGRVVVERAVGTYGGGEVELSGTIDVDGPEPVLDLAVHGRSVPLLRSAEVSLRSDLDVDVSGRWSALDMSGTAALRDARFEQRLDLERLRSLFEAKSGASGNGPLLEVPAITTEPFGTMRLHLDVRSEKPVRVRTPLLRAEIVTSFTVRGTGANPLLGGSLVVDGGRIALPASKLDLSRGRIDFDPNDPGRATLDVTAEGRVSGYDVRARVTGTTDDPEIELTSIPPATQEDLALLVLAGRIPGSQGIGVDEDRVVGEVAAYVARDLAYEWFGDAGESFADRLELATGADVTTSGADTIVVRFRLSGKARGAGRAVYLSGERDVYDRINMGVRFVLRTP